MEKARRQFQELSTIDLRARFSEGTGKEQQLLAQLLYFGTLF